MEPKDGCFPFKWKRLQFPVVPAFAMTVHKAQGQTLRNRVGVYLVNPPFAHGSLYVAASRVTEPNNFKFFTPGGSKYTNNVVHKALLDKVFRGCANEDLMMGGE